MTPRLHASATPWYAEANAALEVGAPLLRRRFTMAVACPGSAGSAAETPLRSGRFIQLDQPLATHGPTGWRLSVMITTIGGEAGRAENGQDAGSATARPRVRQPDANLDEDAGMSRAPKKLIRAIVKRQPAAAPTNNAHRGHPAYLSSVLPHGKAEARSPAGSGTRTFLQKTRLGERVRGTLTNR